MTGIDILLGIETAILVFLGLPLSIRGTFRLIDAVRISTVNDRLARAITLYLSVVTLAALYLLSLTVYRFLAGETAPDFFRPITGAVLLAVLCGPWWIERSVGRRGPTDRDRSESPPS